MQTDDVPLFPLGNLVFPGGFLPLRIFEPRYHDMVRTCLRESRGFVVCPPARKQAGQRHVPPHEVGTYVTICDFDALDDGMLGITAAAEMRVRISTPYEARDGLWLGSIDRMASEPDVELPEQYAHLAELATELLAELGPPFDAGTPEPHSARWVGNRLAELLPIPIDVKAALLELNAPVDRVAQVAQFVQQMIRSR